MEDVEVRRVIIERTQNLPGFKGREITNRKVHGIMGLLQAISCRVGFQFTQPLGIIINCKSGELHLVNGCFVLKSHNRENYFISQVPVGWEPDAECPRFEKYLDDVFRDDPDRGDKAMLVYQLIGYCCLASARFEKFFILVGPGANGKSVLMALIRRLVGIKNTAAVQPDQLDNRFQRTHLNGILVELVVELAQGATIPDAVLKSLVSGEPITGEHKGKAPFEFTPYCTCIFGTNHMPHTRDFSEALFRRAIIITFNRVFSESEQDRGLIDALAEEIPGIFYRSIRALEDVFAHGSFVEPESSRKAKGDWRIEADQVAQFVQECCSIGHGSIQSSRLFTGYQAWAKEAGIHILLGRRSFVNRLKRFGVCPATGNGGVRILSGITFHGFGDL
jgi:P4 family phage/plasmid primase-like protien